ncbi:MAG TPA: hypothetical protein VFJ43_01670 [Bacteroidia bacterium]|nr:hypothetical protein [Bacteroidia bacterium]
MKIGKFFIAIFFLALIDNSCHKDNRELFFPVKPHDFLSSSKYERLELDIVYVEGFQPTSQTISQIESFLEERLNKPSGISVSYKSISSPGKSFYTKDDLDKVEKNERSHFTKGNTLTTFIFFADAPFSTSNVIGLTYGTTSFAVFEYTVHQNSGGIAQVSPYVLETTVAEHEFGHLFGLVDNGTKMQTYHLDAGNGNHCDNKYCLMYYTTETTDILGNLTGGNIPQFDDHCIADLRENGGK